LAFRDADLILFRGKRVTGTCFTSWTQAVYV
jgi:hypothetical protein